MRLIDIPSPGVFSGSATLRKDLCRALSFAQKSYALGSATPAIVKSLENCLDTCLAELAKLHKGEEATETTPEAPESPSEADAAETGTTTPETECAPPEASQSVSEVCAEVVPTPLPSILRKRKNT